MERGLFRKFFAVFLAMLLLAITFLGCMTFLFAGQYLEEDYRERLKTQATQGAAFTDGLYAKTEYAAKPDGLAEGYSLMGGSTQSMVFLVDISGRMLACSDNMTQTSRALAKGLTRQVHDQGSLWQVGDLDGYLPQRSYVYGVPVSNSQGVYGYLFACAPADRVKGFLMVLRQFFLINAVLVVLICFVASYYFTDRTSRPLRQMAKAAKSFTKGDFSARVPVVVGEDDDEINQLAISFNQMADSLDKQEKVRTSFVANISHDLRTPMTTIGGFIDGILDGTIPPEKERKYLQTVSGEVKRLSRLVGTMMNVAKIEAGEVHLAPVKFDLFEETCQILFSFEQQIEGKEIDVVLPDMASVMVYADRDLIHQVVYNLIDNAVKFTPGKGKLIVAFEEPEPEANSVTFCLTNTGKGINPEDIAHIFDRFYKSDPSRGKDKNGVGLGLYIVKSIVDAHGGSIEVTSLVGESTTFRVTLPKAPVPKKHIFTIGGTTLEREPKSEPAGERKPDPKA